MKIIQEAVNGVALKLKRARSSVSVSRWSNVLADLWLTTKSLDMKEETVTEKDLPKGWVLEPVVDVVGDAGWVVFDQHREPISHRFSKQDAIREAVEYAQRYSGDVIPEVQDYLENYVQSKIKEV